MNKPGAVFALVALILIGAIVMGIILAWPIQWLWNHALVGAVNGVNPISFWQAYGIFLLGNLVFRSSVNSKSKDK